MYSSTPGQCNGSAGRSPPRGAAPADLPLAAGLKAVYTARFVPGKILRLMREHRPTILVAIPSMYGALLQAKEATPEDFASLRYVVSGGEPLSDSVAARFHERFGVPYLYAEWRWLLRALEQAR